MRTMLAAMVVVTLLAPEAWARRGKGSKQDLNKVRDDENYSKHFDKEVDEEKKLELKKREREEKEAEKEAKRAEKAEKSRSSGRTSKKSKRSEVGEPAAPVEKL